MSIFKEIMRRLEKALADWRTRRRIDSIDRADVLLAHRIVSRRLPSLGQWGLIGRVLKPGERRIIGWAVSGLAAGALLIAAGWALDHAVLVPADGGEYREGVVGSPHFPNPILAGGNDIDQDIVRLAYSGLYRRDRQGRLSLDLAESADASADGKSYSFRIKDGAFFHDGTPVTADDVVFTIQAIQNPAWKSPLAAGLKGVTAKAADSRTVVLSSDKPSSYLPSLLAFGIMPKHVWEKVDPNSRDLSAFSLKPVGSGPFRFEKFTRDGQGNILSYTLRRASPASASLERITFKFFDDYDTAVDKLTSNSVDGLSFVPPGKLESVQTIPGIVVRSPALEQYTALFLNPKGNPALSDPTVRQALAYAIDREKILKSALGGLGQLRDGPLADGAAGGGSDIARYPYEPAKAAALLDSAGYALAAGATTRAKSVTTPGKTKKDSPTTVSTELDIDLATIDTPENRQAAEIIKEGWEAIGVRSEITLTAAADIQKTVIRPRAYDALLFGEILGPEDDPYPFWHSSQIDAGFNLANWSNRRADELLEKARLAPNAAARAPLLAEFERIVAKDEPAIFLYRPDYPYPQSDKIKGFDVSAMAAPADRFDNAADWYRKFKLAFK